ncbi:MAG: SpoIIE family protein phosphatase [Clostridia bacterium]|nr:SpoIIE family protein phosphatase [Clostridia bacterium]
MDKNKLKKVCLEIGICLLQIIFSNVNIFGVTYFVGFPFALARLYFGANIFFVTGEYVFSKALLFVSFKWVVVTAFEIVLLGLFYLANEYFSIKRRWLRFSLFACLSKMPELYMCISGGDELIFVIAGVLLSVLYSLYFIRLFISVKNKSVFFKFSRFDYLIFASLIFTSFVGLFEFYMIQKYVYLFFIIFAVIVLCRVVQAEKSLIGSGMVAVAHSVITGEYEILFFVFMLSAVLVCVKDLNKYFYAAVTACVCIVFTHIFDFYSIFELFSVYFAVFLFILIPEKLISKASLAFEVDSIELINREVMKDKVNATREKLELMSKTLGVMQSNFKYLIVGKVSREKAATELSNDVINRCCKNCENYKVCFQGNIQKKALFDALLYRAFLNEKVGFDDVSTGLQTYCNKTAIIVSEINQIATKFLGYEVAMKTEDSSKLIVASELENFASIFSNFAKLTKIDCKINKKSAKNIKELFLKALIDVKEVVVYENESGVESVSIIASNAEILKSEAVKFISKVTKIKMQIESIKHLEFSKISLATFVPADKLRLDFAISSKSKENENGDSAAVVKLSRDKFLVAITDGMGHGEKANRISSMVISLIEEMFKIGFDDTLVIDSINKLLLPAGLDNFTTLDVCVIDTKNLVAEFIKMGSSVSLIKHNSQTEMIVSDSLPMGIVQVVKPTIIKKQISAGDIILLASDGVVDSFESIDLYKSFVNDSNIYNLKSYTDSLIFDASYQNQAHPDDMTVIAINLLKK